MESAVIRRIVPGVACAARLRELGIMEGASVLVLKQSNPLLLLAQDSRIAIDPATAGGIEVDVIEAE